MIGSYTLYIWPDGRAYTKPPLPEVDKLLGGKYSPAAKVEIVMVRVNAATGMCVSGGALLPEPDMEFIKAAFSEAVMKQSD